MRLSTIIISTFGTLFASFVFAKDACNKSSATTKDILQCASIQYETVDKKLSEQYQKMLVSLSLPNKTSLLEVERAWVKNRNAYCNYVYNSISPGEEAVIEKMSCWISLTSSRLVELLHLETGVSGDGFYNALPLISRISAKNTDEILLYIESLENRPEEADYYKKNCELTKIIQAENERLCRARMKFQSM